MPRARCPVAKERRRRITFLTNMPEAHKRKRIDNMNVVDHLLEHRFETLSLEEKLEVKRLMSCALQSIYVFPVFVPTAGLHHVVTEHSESFLSQLFSLISPPGHCLGLWEVYSMVN